MALRDDRIWIDGCFDFAHHGHAGAMRQARQLCNELYVGVHSDEDIAQHKGPVVMHLPERALAVEGCKWSTKPILKAPYVTDPKVMDDYQCKYVVHGDDITTDEHGNDCYQTVKDAGRFIVVKRTPNISTTDLVGRMLSTNTNHHLPTVTTDEITSKKHFLLHGDALERFEQYATGADAKAAHSGVYMYTGANAPIAEIVAPSAEVNKGLQKVWYVDGAFDLFFMGHIQLLKDLRAAASKEGALIVVGLHDDKTVNEVKGENYPIMNLQERALCVLQCRYVDAVVLQAPYIASESFVEGLAKAGIQVVKIVHGATPVTDLDGQDPYAWAKKAGIYQDAPTHEFAGVSTRTIVDRVLKNRDAYEERQRKKGWKAENEKKLKDEEGDRFAK
ncbi:YALIA101S01e23684g1_1 [Yarrowia lipolytica]|nr:hypothetical protein YALI1_C08197g [Yarrowia lipolytica]SEI31459.1 YALIA101S01e23684g1_1 [Yarrowia lipolytica]VBB85112.1 Ethanolamine-phosphate cytidylyltransferase, putative [Yarrowia lipolytica]